MNVSVVRQEFLSF